jgi:hypothetical protein
MALDPVHIWAVAKELAWTPAMRTTFEMRFKNRLSYQQIAAHLGVPTQTVGSRLNRAIRVLRSAIVTDIAQSSANGLSVAALSSFEQELNG